MYQLENGHSWILILHNFTFHVFFFTSCQFFFGALSSIPWITVQQFFVRIKTGLECTKKSERCVDWWSQKLNWWFFLTSRSYYPCPSVKLVEGVMNADTRHNRLIYFFRGESNLNTKTLSKHISNSVEPERVIQKLAKRNNANNSAN